MNVYYSYIHFLSQILWFIFNIFWMITTFGKWNLILHTFF